MSNLQPGRYTARPISYAFGSTDKGVDYAALTFDIPFDGGTSEQITAYLYFATTENSRISLEQIRNCGWHGDDLSADLSADGYGSCDVKLVLAEDSYEKDGETKTSLKVKSIWRADGPAVKNPMDETKRKAFAAKMKGLALATKPAGAPAPNGTAQPRKAAPAQRSYGPHANEPDMNDPRFSDVGAGVKDDLPFLPPTDSAATDEPVARAACVTRRSDTAPQRGRPGAVC